MSYYIFLSENVAAFKGVWTIEDDFIYNTFTRFQAAKLEVKMDETTPPFLHEYYNVQFYYQLLLSNIKSFEARIVNSLIDAHNEKTNKFRLPKYILIIPDKDIIESALSRITGFSIKSIMRESTEYITKEFTKIIVRRKDDLKSKRGGVIASSAEPRLIWVTIIKRPFNTHPSKHQVYKMVGKANDVMEEMVRK